MAEIENVKVKISADTSQFNSEIDKTTSHINNLQESLNAIQRAINAVTNMKITPNVKGAEGIKDEYLKQIQDVINVVNTEIDSLTKRMFSAMDKYGVDSSEATILGENIDNLDSYTNNLKKYQEMIKKGQIEVDVGNVEEIPKAVQKVAEHTEEIINKSQMITDAYRGLTGAADEWWQKTRGPVKGTQEEIDALVEAVKRYIDILKQAGVTEEEFRKRLGFNRSSQTSEKKMLNQMHLDYNSTNPVTPPVVPEPKKEKKEASTPITDWKTIVKGMLGIRSIYTLIRKIVSQNEYFTQAVNNVLTVIGNFLEPLLTFLASLINALGNLLARLLGVSTETNKTVERTLASFDELEILNKTSTVEIPTLKEVLSDTTEENPYKPSAEAIEEWEQMHTKFATAWNNFWSGEAWNKLKTGWSTFWSNVGASISEWWEKRKTALDNWWNGTVKPNWDKLTTFFSTTLPETFTKKIPEWWNGVCDKWSTRLNTWYEDSWIKTVLDSIDSFFQKIGDWIDKVKEKLGIDSEETVPDTYKENLAVPTDLVVETKKNTTTMQNLLDFYKKSNNIAIPSFATGAVLTSPTIAMVGDASTPEIVTPQGLLKSTIDSSNTQVVSALAQMTRQIISSIENVDMQVSIGDDVIAKSAARGNNSWKAMTGRALI